MGKAAEHRLLSRPIRLRIFSILKKETEKGSLLTDLIALIELTPVRSPGFEKESAVMSPLIRPEPQEERKVKDSLQEKEMHFFLVFSVFCVSDSVLCWDLSPGFLKCRRHRGSGHYAGSLCSPSLRFFLTIALLSDIHHFAIPFALKLNNGYRIASHVRLITCTARFFIAFISYHSSVNLWRKSIISDSRRLAGWPTIGQWQLLQRPWGIFDSHSTKYDSQVINVFCELPGSSNSPCNCLDRPSRYFFPLARTRSS